MAKDILLDVNAGDLLLENGNGNVDYLDVVWGNLFSTDAKLYMNIVFPEGRQLDFVNNELVLCVSAKYKPSCSNFFIRLVYEGVDGTYSKISSVNARVAKEYAAYWRKTPVSVAEKLKASNLPYINIDGKYIVRIGAFDGVDCEVAFVYSAYNSDFVIGDADTQSAQLLTLCGPGKYYRYPTSGVDITKYINSIVANTDLGETLMREFDGDNKSIEDAVFDSVTGNLDFTFNSSNIEGSQNLPNIESLDLDIFKSTEEKYAKNTIEESDSSDYVIIEFQAINGSHNVSDIVDGELLTGLVQAGYIFNSSGTPVSRGDYQIVTVDVTAKTMVMFLLPSGYSSPVLFVLKENNRTVYVQNSYVPDVAYYNNFDGSYRAIAYIMRDCTLSYAIPRASFDYGYGAFRI